jgi:hypothetical protein
MRKNSGNSQWFSTIATVILCGVLFLAASPGAAEQQKEGPREQIFQLLTGLGTDIGVTARDLNASEIRGPSLTSGRFWKKSARTALPRARESKRATSSSRSTERSFIAGGNSRASCERPFLVRRCRRR